MTGYILSNCFINLQDCTDGRKCMTQRLNYSGLFGNFDGSRFTRASCRPPCCQYKVGDILDSFAFFDAAKDSWTISSHQLGVSVHDFERGINVLRNIDLEKITPFKYMGDYHITLRIIPC